MKNYTNNIQVFWQWFENQYEDFIKQHCYLKKPAYDLQKRLEDIHPEICFQIAHKMDVFQYELIFSCGHLQELKPLIKEIAAKAPDFPLLKVTAFKQRTKECEGICLEETSIHVNEIHFKLVPLFNKVIIHLFTNYNIQSNEVQVAIILLLENLIGEELMLDHVADIQFHPYPPEGKLSLVQLSQIALHFDGTVENLQKAWQEN